MSQPDSRKPLIEIGIVAASLDAVALTAVEQAANRLWQRLANVMEQFEWRIAIAPCDECGSQDSVEPMTLLDLAQQQRDARGWDFALVVTAADLASHYKPFSFAAISSALDAAVVSTARIDPRSSDLETTDEQRRDALQDRLAHLVLHCFGHWLGLAHDPDPGNVMHPIESVGDLRSDRAFTAEQLALMRSTLEDIADQRLEEQAEFRKSRRPVFYLRAAWENRDEIRDAVLQARPWQFPIRLSRLTTAAVSTVLILLMTAETWDVASSQSGTTVVVLSLVALGATTGYVAVRQRLLLGRDGGRLTEQIVTSNVAAVVIVAVGMLVTYALLLALALTAGWCLFPQRVLDGWVASIAKPLEAVHHLLVAGFVASLGIIIGALGASFEQHHYFRHVVFVDEEL
ncbi:MAG: hypothetical protein CMJ58_14880 [Planctomycetaceae bacterium]|nr:hypothetical protein [Planctomycetaceae bacterium]